MVCISTVFARFDGRANDKLLYVNLFITIVLVISSYMIARYLLRLEIEKHILIKESDQKQIQLTEQLKYDSLTGLYNMSTFYSNLNATLDKEEFPLSVAVIDIDNFKNVNDTYGHDNGNTVLIYLARLLDSHCSAMGSAYRYGGEEFVVIFRTIAAEEVMPVIEDIQHIFAAYRFEFAPKVSITFSCGIDSTYQKECKGRELFNNADKAMYEAKTVGKNRTIIYQTETNQK
jgi:diguanylate cyclase (GGDEF)-like protein